MLGGGLGVGLGLLVAKLLNLIIPIPSELLGWLRRVSKAENVDCVSHLKGQKGLLGQPSIILIPIGLLGKQGSRKLQSDGLWK